MPEAVDTHGTIVTVSLNVCVSVNVSPCSATIAVGHLWAAARAQEGVQDCSSLWGLILHHIEHPVKGLQRANDLFD